MAVNGEDVKDAPRDHVIQLVRSCETQVSLLVCQPEMLPCSPGRKSTLLSPARKEKLRNKRPSRVRFAESVCVNGAPLFPVSFTLSCYWVISFLFLFLFSSFTLITFSRVGCFNGKCLSKLEISSMHSSSENRWPHEINPMKPDTFQRTKAANEHDENQRLF